MKTQSALFVMQAYLYRQLPKEEVYFVFKELLHSASGIPESKFSINAMNYFANKKKPR